MTRAAIEITAHEHGTAVMRYRLNSTGYSSERYGVCEHCKQHASEVFHLTSYMLFERQGAGGLSGFGWAHGFNLFGHADCLKARRIGCPVLTINPGYGHYNDANFRALVCGVEILIGCEREGFKVYIGDRYEAIRPTLAAAYRFAEEAVKHPDRRRPITAAA